MTEKAKAADSDIGQDPDAELGSNLPERQPNPDPATEAALREANAEEHGKDQGKETLSEAEAASARQRALEQQAALDRQREAEQQKADDSKASAKKKAVGMPKRVWIILEENDDIPPTGLFVSHNGNPFLIRTGEPVEVPEFLLGILDAAITTVAITDPTTRRVVGHRDRMRYSYRRVAAPAKDE